MVMLFASFVSFRAFKIHLIRYSAGVCYSKVIKVKPRGGWVPPEQESSLASTGIRESVNVSSEFGQE